MKKEAGSKREQEGKTEMLWFQFCFLLFFQIQLVNSMTLIFLINQNTTKAVEKRNYEDDEEGEEKKSDKM